MALRKFTFLNATEGYVQEQATADELSIGKLTLVGVSGVAIDGGGFLASNFADPVSNTDLVTKQYADSIAVGITDFKQSVRLATTANLVATRTSNILTADANGAIGNIDGVAAGVNNRVLVKNQTTAADNGIYYISDGGSAGTPYVLTRTLDADASSEVTPGMYMFVEEGTTLADTAWILTTDGTVVLNTTSLTFVQFSALKDLIAGAGLVKSGNTLDIELDTDSGLEFDTGGVAGKLRTKPDGTRGIAKDSSGLYAKVGATNPGIMFDGSGNLQTKLDASGGLQHGASGDSILIDSTWSNLSLSASGLKVTKSPALTRREVASGAIAAFAAVYVSGNGVVSTGDSSNDTKSHVVGVAKAGISDTATGEIAVEGDIVIGALSGATAGIPYYMNTSGLPVVYGSVASNNRIIRLGFAYNATDLFVKVQDMGKKA